MALTPLLAAENEPAKRLNDAATVLAEIMDSPDKGIPQDPPRAIPLDRHCSRSQDGGVHRWR
jgi:hypothetical protein